MYLKRTYGISLEQYKFLLSEQGGCCAICQRKPKNRSLAVDHCHRTGFVRGLLCPSCNKGLGAFDDREASLLAASNYLKKAERDWDSLNVGQQDEWLPFRGRSSGKGRRARVSKEKPNPSLPRWESRWEIL